MALRAHGGLSVNSGKARVVGHCVQRGAPQLSSPDLRLTTAGVVPKNCQGLVGSVRMVVHPLLSQKAQPQRQLEL